MNDIPLWLFTGPEIGERNDAVEAIRSLAEQQGALDSHSLYASDVTIGSLVSLLQNGSLFADARFVVLKNAEEIKKKEDIELLTQWAQGASHNKDAYLILVSDEISIDKKVEALVPKQHKKIFWELFENKKEQWIYSFFKREGFSIESEAVSALLDLVENNTDALRTVCSQIILFYPKGTVLSEDDIDSVLSHTKEESPFSLFDTLIKNDFTTALEIYRKMAMSKDSSPVQVIAGLSYCFRRLVDWHELQEAGTSDDFSLKRKGFTSKKAIDQYRMASRRWNHAITRRILALLAHTDYEIRSTGTTMHDSLMELCLYSINKKQGQSLALAEY